MAPALNGIRILDFSTLLPGPLATRMLAACGADVIKIEPPRGDDMRAIGLGAQTDEAVYSMLNAGKRIARIDLKAAGAQEKVLDLVDDADILVEQFRPGVMKRLGLGYDDLQARNPKLIYCSITGYGQDGPLAQQAGHDLTYLAKTGILALSPGSVGSPCVPPVLAADIAGGSYPAVMNILLALMAREKSGKGIHLDIAMADGLFPFAFWALAQGGATGQWPQGSDQLLNGGSPRYRLYSTRDGSLVAVAAIEEKFWQRFCDEIDLPDALRAHHADAYAVVTAIAERIRARESAHWRAVFDNADCCCAVVDTLQTATANPHFLARSALGSAWSRQEEMGFPDLPIPLDREFRGDERSDTPASAAVEEQDVPQWRRRA